MEYTLIHCAKKNIGDFLIFEKAKKILESEFKTKDFLEVKGREYIQDDLLKQINKTKAIIICGGPGLQERIYPLVYPLRNNLDEILVPIYTLGSGRKGIPGDNTSLFNYRFTNKSKKLLDKISYFGVRDYKTKTALIINGYKNVSMNGCPVWYDLKSIGKNFKLPENQKNIKNIVFTPAQNSILHKQSIDCLYLLKKLFPESNIIVSFQRGTEEDKETSKKEATNVKKIVNVAKSLNLEVKDTSYSTEKIKFYDKCDLHIGYKVHGHIYFLSKRLPSILIHEDGRGVGVSESIGINGINGWKRNIFSVFIEKISNRYITYIYNKIFGIIKPNKNCIKELENTLNNYIDNNFNKYKGVKEVIDSNFIIMKDFINNKIIKGK